MTPLAPPRLAPGLIGRWLRGRTVGAASVEWTRRAGDDWAGRILQVDARDRFHAKQGRSVARWRVGGESSPLVVYLKRHYELPRWRGVLAALFPWLALSPARQEAANLAWARAARVPVPEAPAWAEFLRPGGRLQSALAVEELTGQLALHEAIPLAAEALPAAAFGAWKRSLVVELARLSRELHRRRAFHKDLYLCHFYVRESDCLAPPASWRGRVTVIDLHRLGRHPLTAGWWRAKDLAQLAYSADGVAGLTWRDAARFWRAYRRGDWSGWAPPGALAARLVRIRLNNYVAQKRRRSARAAGG